MVFPRPPNQSADPRSPSPECRSGSTPPAREPQPLPTHRSRTRKEPESKWSRGQSRRGSPQARRQPPLSRGDLYGLRSDTLTRLPRMSVRAHPRLGYLTAKRRRTARVRTRSDSRHPGRARHVDGPGGGISDRTLPSTSPARTLRLKCRTRAVPGRCRGVTMRCCRAGASRPRTDTRAVVVRQRGTVGPATGEVG